MPLLAKQLEIMDSSLTVRDPFKFYLISRLQVGFFTLIGPVDLVMHTWSIRLQRRFFTELLL